MQEEQQQYNIRAISLGHYIIPSYIYFKKRGVAKNKMEKSSIEKKSHWLYHQIFAVHSTMKNGNILEKNEEKPCPEINGWVVC